MPRDVEMKNLRRLDEGTLTGDGTIFGSKRGHPVHKIAKKPARPSTNKRGKFVRDLMYEVAGYSPLERRVIELLKISKDKRARKLAKKRLGTLKRAKRKVDAMSRVITEQRRAQQH